MKKTLKLIAVMLVLAMTIVLVPAFTVSASDDANTILVGEGLEAAYATVTEAIAGVGVDVEVA